MGKTVEIIGTPDRLRLAFCLLEGDNKMQETVCFTVRDSGTTREWIEYVKLNGVEREDGSGQSFNITGYNIANSAQVKITMSFKTRRGTMTFN